MTPMPLDEAVDVIMKAVEGQDAEAMTDMGNLASRALGVECPNKQDIISASKLDIASFVAYEVIRLQKRAEQSGTSDNRIFLKSQAGAIIGRAATKQICNELWPDDPWAKLAAAVEYVVHLADQCDLAALIEEQDRLVLEKDVQVKKLEHEYDVKIADSINKINRLFAENNS